MTTTAILKLKTTLPELAAECLALFGEGARLEDCGAVYTFKLNNTEPQNGYFRVNMAQHIAMGLDYATSQGYVSPNAELISIEWLGQDRVEVGTDEDGQPIIEEQPFVVGTVENEDGITRPEYLTRIAR